ncbi:MAG: phage holin family protein, partial [Candidatus Eremiobacteraeota bacterium]|nr:phage holin family protein [Candidatus Eremiobacteraeota bacterium]
LIAALSLVVPVWAAFAIAGAIWGVATAVLAIVGKRKVADAWPLVPEQTIRAVKEDIAASRRRR